VQAGSGGPENSPGVSSLPTEGEQKPAEGKDPTPSPAEIKKHVDQVCDGFENAWLAAGLTGAPPPLKDFLHNAPEYEYPYLLHELVKLDVYFRGARKETPRPDDYRTLLPTPPPPWLPEVFAVPATNTPFATRVVVNTVAPLGTPEDGSTGSDGNGFPTIPGYAILAELGRGAMGVVYKARQQGLNRIVALKMILNAQYASPQERDRFRAEAEAVARLHHPNIVQIYEIGEYQGQPFFSLEFCAGGSLAEALERRNSTLSAREAAGLLETLARALHVAHQAQVIHRDLKPANILLDENNTPRITDFGLAKRLDVSHQTQSGAILGTPCYMSPEQARGEIRRVGPASDGFALSAILYEVLTGRPPFKGDNVFETLLQVRNDDPVPPRRLQPRVPLDIETICLKGLHKDPARRYGSAEELADDLRRFLNNEPIRARPVSAWERAVKWAWRNPWMAGACATGLLAVAAVLVSLVLGVIYYRATTENLERKNKEQSRESDIDNRIPTLWAKGKDAEGDGDKAHRENRIADAARDYRAAADLYAELQALLEKERPDHDLLPQTRIRRQRIEQALHRQTTRAEWSDLARLTLKDYFTIVYFYLKRFDQLPDGMRQEIRQLAVTALARLRLHVPSSPAETRSALENLREQIAPDQFRQVAGACYEVLLVLADAEATFPQDQDQGERVARAQQALKVLEVAAVLGSAIGIDSTRAFHLRRSRYRTQAGDAGEARLDLERAVKLQPRTALDHCLIAVDAFKEGDRQRVIDSCREALQHQPNYFWAHYLRASVRLMEKRAAEAEAELLACLESGAEIPWLHLALASAHLELGDLASAEKDFTKALACARNPVEQYPILTNRSLLWLRLEKEPWDKAMGDLQKAIGLQPGSYEAYVHLAEVHRRRKEWPKALAALDRAEQRHPGTPALALIRARILQESKDLERARRAFEQTIDREPNGSKSERLLSSLVELGYLKHQAREYDQALADFDRALAIDPTYLLAYREKANTLIVLKRDQEAGKVLDQYLALARGRRDHPTFEIHKARGLIHARLHKNPEAIEAFTQALMIEDDLDTRNRRGWVYLALNSPPLALADFNKVLGRQASHADALCGRAHALIRLNQLEQALKDAEQALKEGKSTPRLLLGAARVHAWVASGGFGQASATPIPRHVKRVAELLEDALRQQAQEERASFFVQRIRKEPAFASLWRDPGMQQLARSFER
jgi:serine/threonine protein kinase/tetratricopeptide (TPR) repeat protein